LFARLFLARSLFPRAILTRSNVAATRFAFPGLRSFRRSLGRFFRFSFWFARAAEGGF
jgi:hypothetical protein